MPLSLSRLSLSGLTEPLPAESQLSAPKRGASLSSSHAPTFLRGATANTRASGCAGLRVSETFFDQHLALFCEAHEC